jgi:hypothetical protein
MLKDSAQDSREFHNALSDFATGVAVITAALDGVRLVSAIP